MKSQVLTPFEAFGSNPYPGRGFVVGVSDDGRFLVQVYWIMGRSENSRNRVFRQDGGRVYTEAADPSKVSDPSLIIYNAMIDVETGTHLRNGQRTYAIVSNGAQTDIAANGIPRRLHETLRQCEYEPDKPNFTPRITALSVWLSQDRKESEIELSSIRRAPNGTCERHFHTYENVTPGTGYCLTTYDGDGEPLPSYDGEPYLVRLEGSPVHLMSEFKKALNPENLVSIAVKSIPKDAPSKVLIHNKYKQRGAAAAAA